MSVELVISQHPYALKAKSFYIPTEYTFVFDVDPLPESSGLLLIFDTLTVTFDSKTKIFTSLDAFTNIVQWQLFETITLPKISGKGSLVFIKGFEDPEEDRVSFGFMPAFEYTKEGIVKIKFSNESEHSCKFYQFSPGALVGLKGTKLVSFIFPYINLHQSIPI